MEEKYITPEPSKRYQTVADLKLAIKDLPDDMIIGGEIWDGSAVEINGVDIKIVTYEGDNEDVKGNPVLVIA